MTSYLQHAATGLDSIVSRLLNDPTTVDAANQDEFERVIKGMAITCYLGKRVESFGCPFLTYTPHRMKAELTP